jgi:hypothetical protein
MGHNRRLKDAPNASLGQAGGGGGRATSIPASVRDKAPPGPNGKGCDMMKPHLQPPWAIGGCYAELQRWIYLGTGTYRMCSRARARALSLSLSLSLARFLSLTLALSLYTCAPPPHLCVCEYICVCVYIYRMCSLQNMF